MPHDPVRLDLATDPTPMELRVEALADLLREELRELPPGDPAVLRAFHVKLIALMEAIREHV